MSDWKKLSENLRMIEAVADELRYLARCFKDTGNDKLWIELSGMSADLKDCTSNITKLDAEASSERLQQSQDFMFSALAACVKPHLDALESYDED